MTYWSQTIIPHVKENSWQSTGHQRHLWCRKCSTVELPICVELKDKRVMLYFSWTTLGLKSYRAIPRGCVTVLPSKRSRAKFLGVLLTIPTWLRSLNNWCFNGFDVLVLEKQISRKEGGMCYTSHRGANGSCRRYITSKHSLDI